MLECADKQQKHTEEAQAMPKAVGCWWLVVGITLVSLAIAITIGERKWLCEDKK